MTIELDEEPMTALAEYARVPIVFTVDRVLDVTSRDDGSGGFALSERSLDVPYEKDYDAIAGEGPFHWARRFDLSNWAFFMARCRDPHRRWGDRCIRHTRADDVGRAA